MSVAAVPVNFTFEFVPSSSVPPFIYNGREVPVPEALKVRVYPDDPRPSVVPVPTVTCPATARLTTKVVEAVPERVRLPFTAVVVAVKVFAPDPERVRW